MTNKKVALLLPHQQVVRVDIYCMLINKRLKRILRETLQEKTNISEGS